jgi:hypothetical protein
MIPNRKATPTMSVVFVVERSKTWPIDPGLALLSCGGAPGGLGHPIVVDGGTRRLTAREPRVAKALLLHRGVGALGYRHGRPRERFHWHLDGLILPVAANFEARFVADL